MGYVESQLMPKEEIRYRAHLHWIIFLYPVLVFVIGIIVTSAASASGAKGFGEFLIVVGVVWGLWKLLIYTTSEYAVTNRRVIIKVGIIRRATLELLLRKVEGINVNQSILGRILGYGAVVLTGTGGSKDPYRFIARPLDFRKAALTEIEGVSESNSAPTAAA